MKKILYIMTVKAMIIMSFITSMASPNVSGGIYEKPKVIIPTNCEHDYKKSQDYYNGDSLFTCTKCGNSKIVSHTARYVETDVIDLGDGTHKIIKKCQSCGSNSTTLHQTIETIETHNFAGSGSLLLCTGGCGATKAMTSTSTPETENPTQPTRPTRPR